MTSHRLPGRARRCRGTANAREARAGSPSPPRSQSHSAPGYHRAEISTGTERVETTIIRAPVLAPGLPAPARHGWGVFAPTYALRGPRANSPVGTLTDLDDLAQWAHGSGASVVSTLPLLAAFLDEPCEPSPYSPVSLRFWNEMIIDPARVPELGDACSPGDGVEKMRHEPLIDWRAAHRVQREQLERGPGPPARARRRPRHRVRPVPRRPRPTSPRTRRSRAAVEEHGADRARWPSSLSTGPVDERAVDPERAEYHEYVQWLAELADDRAHCCSRTTRPVPLPRPARRVATPTGSTSGARARGVRRGRHRRRTARRVLRPRPGLGVPADASRGPTRRRLPRAAPGARAPPPSRGRAADRPRHGPAPPLDHPVGARRGSGRLRALPRRRSSPRCTAWRPTGSARRSWPRTSARSPRRSAPCSSGTVGSACSSPSSSSTRTDPASSRIRRAGSSPASARTTPRPSARSSAAPTSTIAPSSVRSTQPRRPRSGRAAPTVRAALIAELDPEGRRRHDGRRGAGGAAHEARTFRRGARAREPRGSLAGAPAAERSGVGPDEYPSWRRRAARTLDQIADDAGIARCARPDLQATARDATKEPSADRDRSLPAARGPPLPAARAPRRAHRRGRRRGRRVGAACQRGVGDQRLERLEPGRRAARTRSRDGQVWAGCVPSLRRGRPLQVPPADAPTATSRRRTRSPPRPSTRLRPRRCSPTSLRLVRPGLDATRAGRRPRRGADVGVRDAPRVVAPRAGRGALGYREIAEPLADHVRDSASPTSSCCR